MSERITLEQVWAATPTQSTIDSRITKVQPALNEPYFRAYYLVNGKQYFRYLNALKAAIRMGR